MATETVALPKTGNVWLRHFLKRYRVDPMHPDPVVPIRPASEKAARGRENCAFSLVELLVTVVIIGILAALLLAATSQTKARALRMQCVNNLHQLGVGLQTILADDHGYPVFRTSTNKSDSVADRFWLGQLEREGLGIPKPATNFYQNGVWFCPSTQWSDSMQRGNLA